MDYLKLVFERGLNNAVQQLEEDAIRSVVGNTTQAIAASRLKLNKETLRHKLKKLGIVFKKENGK